MENVVLVDDSALSPEVAAGVAGGIVAGSLVVFGIIYLIYAVLQIIACWKVFEKAGKPGWHSIIPFLNTYDEVDLCWNSKAALGAVCLSLAGVIISPFIQRQQNMGLPISGALLITCIVLAIASICLSVLTSLRMAKVFGKGTGFAIGLIFLQPIFMLILGFSKAKYIGKQE